MKPCATAPKFQVSALTPSAAEPVLLRLSFSHYCQKAEWALSYHGIPYKTVDIPLTRMGRWMPALPDGTVPALVVGNSIVSGSEAIIRWADAHGRDKPPLGADDDVARWESWADETIGPVARREAYRCIHDRPSHYGTKRWLHAVFRLGRGQVLKIQKFYKSRRFDAADEEAVPEILARITAQLDATGTGYLFANRPTAADLATAALWKPMLPIFDHPARRLPEWDVVAEYVRRVKPASTTRTGRVRWTPKRVQKLAQSV